VLWRLLKGLRYECGTVWHTKVLSVPNAPTYLVSDEVKKKFNNTDFSFSLNLSQILNDCEGEGLGVYTLLDLRQLYDVSELENWQEKFGIDNVIQVSIL
jgi:hypothetical protein